jgi:glycosyltransferase involved in cell wall biosynthesis
VSFRRRVLVVAYYFPPLGGGGVNRTVQLVRRLVRAGWQPLVLTVDDAAWARDTALSRRIPPQVKVLRIPNPDWGRVVVRAGGRPQPSAGRGRLQRWLVPDLHVGWSLLASGVAATLAVARAIDAVYTTAPPYSAHAAGLAARRLGIPWIADFRDAWTLCHARRDLPPRRIVLERRLEEAVMKRANRVLFASEAVRRRYLARLSGLAHRSETVLTGFDPEEFRGAEEVVPDPLRFSIVHAGSASRDEKTDTFLCFLEALRLWSRREYGVADTVEVAFVGGEPSLREAIAVRGLARWVKVESSVSRVALAGRLRRAHRCLYLAPVGDFGADPVPGKLFDAVGAGRRLLALAPEGPVSRLIEDLDLGEAIPPDDLDGLIASLSEARRSARLQGQPPGPGASALRSLDARFTMSRVVRALEAACQQGGVSCPSPSAW